VFDSAGEVVAMGDHMPVHLGSMPMSVRAAIETLRLEPGDMAMLNDPYAGGTHLPDITLVLPVFLGRGRAPSFYVSSRAHHAPNPPLRIAPRMLKNQGHMPQILS
jgi:N-methylhydantoinase B